mgnify:CR=1 FL=1
MNINIYIDSLTDCLVDAATGEIFNTEYHRITKPISRQEAAKLKKDGWKFDWSVPFKKGYEVYTLHILGNEAIQGMIALQHHCSEYYTYVDIVEAAPANIGKTGKYKGVGAHLFAIACKLSWDAGNEGYVQFVAKTDLIEHYKSTLNAQCIDWHTMYIDSYGAIELIKKYFKEASE